MGVSFAGRETSQKFPSPYPSLQNFIIRRGIKTVKEMLIKAFCGPAPQDCPQFMNRIHFSRQMNEFAYISRRGRSQNLYHPHM
ncbi:MAG: hypothetical protein DBY37_10505 [Desulfovibrionaceae bacterium]|nr:MAG: hypothetical protein DBY37_10505 [Desulfovibrionaceae bacterium]